MNRSSLAGSNILRVKKHNLRAVLLTFLHAGSLSRVQLAEQTTLSNTTITNLTAELIEHGIIVETSDQATPGKARRGVGRPRTMLQLVPDARFVVGVHIGIGMFRVAITNLHAEIVQNKIVNFSIDQPAEEVLQLITQTIQAILAESAIEPYRILGIGVGASGLVNYQTGINLRAASLGWQDVPIREHLEDQLGLPVCVDNNVRAMALGEAYFGLGRGVDVLAFIYGRIGVGAGFVINGQLFRGFGAGAGEIGHTIVLPHNGALCRCGQRGCLETLVSEPVLLQDAWPLAEAYPDGVLASHLNKAVDDPVEAVFAAARAGDTPTLQMIEERAYYLGIALANLVNVLNPEMIVLGGMFAQAGDLIIPVAEGTMRKTAFAQLGERVRLQPTQFGWRAGVVGAASLALMGLFYAADRDLAVQV